DEKPVEVVRLEELGLVGDARPRPDERHLAANDVHELRQLVQARAPKPGAERRDVVAAVELVEAVAVRRRAGVHDLPDVVAMRRLFGVRRHRPELQEREGPPALAEPDLAKQNGPARVALDAPGDPREERKGEHEEHAADGEVERALQRPVEPRRLRGEEVDERQALEEMEVAERPERLEEPRDDVDVDAFLASGADELDETLVGLAGERDDDAVDLRLPEGLDEVARGSEDGHVLELGSDRTRLSVEEAHDAQTPLGMLDELPRDELADLARADDERPLGVGAVTANAGADR